jgi:hypothetical protein
VINSSSLPSMGASSVSSTYKALEGHHFPEGTEGAAILLAPPVAPVAPVTPVAPVAPVAPFVPSASPPQAP